MKIVLPLAIIFAAIAITSCDDSRQEPKSNVVIHEESVPPTGIAKLAAEQLDAYNRADLDDFCECYHPDVRVFDGETEKPAGIEAFRQRYESMFTAGGFSATVSKRVVHGDHCVDLEHWQRKNGKQGTVLVRYTEKDGLIGIVQFLK